MPLEIIIYLFTFHPCVQFLWLSQGGVITSIIQREYLILKNTKKNDFLQISFSLNNSEKKWIFFSVSPDYFVQGKFNTGRHHLKMRNFQTV